MSWRTPYPPAGTCIKNGQPDHIGKCRQPTDQSKTQQDTLQNPSTTAHSPNRFIYTNGLVGPQLHCLAPIDCRVDLDGSPARSPSIRVQLCPAPCRPGAYITRIFCDYLPKSLAYTPFTQTKGANRHKARPHVWWLPLIQSSVIL